VADEVFAPFKDQIQQVLVNITDALALSGSAPDRILSATVFLSDIRFYEEMNAAWDKWVQAGCSPARTTVEARLAAPGYFVEITVIAAR
jgi:enamine deaminase RidA (YjgF/YER057c/UK114 family)